MSQQSRPNGQSATKVWEDTPSANGATQTLTGLPWAHTRWTFGVRWFASGAQVAEGSEPTAGTLTFRIKTEVSDRWEVFSANAVDLSSADGGYSVTAAAHITAVEVVTDSVTGGSATHFALYATGSGEGRV